MDPSVRENSNANCVSFVFQGGGSVAATQVGMLRALTEAGVKADLVVGSSAGALNAVMFASDPTMAGIDRLEKLWMSLRRRHVAPVSIRSVVAALAGRRDALMTNTALGNVVRSADVASQLEDTAIPAHIMATDLRDGRPVVLSTGDTVSALLASAAFPGIYPPVSTRGRLLIDGGVGADIPVLQSEQLGATESFVLPAAVTDTSNAVPRGPVPLVFHAVSQLLDAVSRRDLALAAQPVHMLPAPLTRAGVPLDFRETRHLIDDGYHLTRRWLDDHRCSHRSLPAADRPPMFVSATG
jgi:NTE family protein